jgi:hypothetical protein
MLLYIRKVRKEYRIEFVRKYIHNNFKKWQYQISDYRHSTGLQFFCYFLQEVGDLFCRGCFGIVQFGFSV